MKKIAITKSGSGIRTGSGMSQTETIKDDIRSGERQGNRENAGSSSDAFDIPKIIY